MPAPKMSPEHFRRRLVGLYALTLMEREGPLHGYRLSEAIAERTEGAWRPGPGSVYPSLKKLVDSGLATSRVSGRRRTYTISRKGIQLLREIRTRNQRFLFGKMDGTLLWTDILGEKDAGEYLLRRLRHVWDSTEMVLESGRTSPADKERLKRRLKAELHRELEHLSGLGSGHSSLRLL